MQQKLRNFIDRYKAYFGNFPASTEEVFAVWWDWLESIPTIHVDELFKQIKAQRAKHNIRARPTMEDFERAYAEVLNLQEGNSDAHKSKAEKEAEEEMKIPLFSFEKEGFPRQRQAYLMELPAKLYKPLWAEWDRMMGFEITPSEFKTEADRLGWYLPEWSDYTEAEQEAACVRWKIQMPEEERCPF